MFNYTKSINYKCHLIFGNGQISFNEMLTFNLLPFRHFLQEVNEIWYPGRAITCIKLLRYKISLSSRTKYRNDKN